MSLSDHGWSEFELDGAYFDTDLVDHHKGIHLLPIKLKTEN
jgi:hypothetical protein